MLIRILATAALSLSLALPAHAATISATIEGTDAIFLAGRTDLIIPDPSDPWPGGMIRHTNPTPEEAKETLPDAIAIAGGDIVRVLDPAIGGINFFNGLGPGFFGPEGTGGSGASNLNSFGGISGYLGPRGALVGVFLDNNVPTSGAPSTLNTATSVLGQSSVSPLLGQVFYIGTGVEGAGFREYIAPTGATRLFLGIPDGFSFNGAPGAYDDNDGSYQVRVAVNSIPTPAVPLPAAGWMLLAGLGGLISLRRRAT